MQGRTIEMKDVMAALHLTDRNIREREGRSFPVPVSDRPRLYLLADVIWWTNGQERTIILQALKIDVQTVKAAMVKAAEAHGSHRSYYIPPPSDLESSVSDPLMQ